MPTSSSEGLKLQLRTIRERRGLTQGELGQRAKMASASISHFETGQRVPSLDSLVKLADALEVSVDELLGRTLDEASTKVDPLFLRASRASIETLDAVKRVTAALLRDDQGT
ncbi:MAG: XRE family transcriptional regulator [Dehalococcoidia bacterium]|nr:MAG: XRE family transcriptional regulator [Dehalococcoidia bacterium]